MAPITQQDQANVAEVTKKSWPAGVNVSWPVFNGQYMPKLRHNLVHFGTDELPLYRGIFNGRATFDWDGPACPKAVARGRARNMDNNRTTKAAIQAMAMILAEPLRQAGRAELGGEAVGGRHRAGQLQPSASDSSASRRSRPNANDTCSIDDVLGFSRRHGRGRRICCRPGFGSI